jgi:hypothetical protein
VNHPSLLVSAFFFKKLKRACQHCPSLYDGRKTFSSQPACEQRIRHRTQNVPALSGQKIRTKSFTKNRTEKYRKPRKLLELYLQKKKK